MPTVTYYNETFPCTTALKGADYIHLLDDAGNMIAAFDGVVDFSGFFISDGDWTSPTAADFCSVAVIEDDGTLGESSFAPKDFLKTDATPGSIGAAPASIAFTLNLPASAWGTNGWAPMEQVANTLPHYMFDGNGVAKNLIISPAPESHLVWGECMIRCTGQWGTDLGFTCETLPTADLVAHVLIVG